MKTVALRGRLGRLFGKSFRLDIDSASEAVQALICQLPGLSEELLKGWYKIERVSEYGIELTGQDRLGLRLGKVHTLRFVPVASGAAKGGLFGIIAGAFLVAASFVLTAGTLTAPALTLMGATITGTQLAFVGGLLAVSGIMSMMAPEVGQTPEPEKDRPSFMISSPSNIANQGHPVPWVAGKDVWLGSIVVSNAIHVEDFN